MMARFLSLSSYLLVLMMLLLSDLHLFASSPAVPPLAPASPPRKLAPAVPPLAPASPPWKLAPAVPPLAPTSPTPIHTPAPTPHTPPSMPTPTPGPPRAPTSEPSNDGKSGLKSGQKAGIAIGVILGAGIIGFAGFVYKKRKANIRRARLGSAARGAQL